MSGGYWTVEVVRCLRNLLSVPLDYLALRVEKKGKKRDEVKWKKIRMRKRKGRKKLEQVKRKK